MEFCDLGTLSPSLLLTIEQNDKKLNSKIISPHDFYFFAFAFNLYLLSRITGHRMQRGKTKWLRKIIDNEGWKRRQSDTLLHRFTDQYSCFL